MFNPRPMQAEILKYRSGWMGVSAVPGSGKTHTLSSLAANLIMDAGLKDNQEILIVTLVNSAVDNFSARIGGFIKEKGLLPDIGYRVRTLHGLAHDIVRENPEKAGLNNRFTIIDDSESDRMLEELSVTYLRTHPDIQESYVLPDFQSMDFKVKRSWEDAVTSLNRAFISQAKDLQLDPESLRELIDKFHFDDPVFSMAAEVYAQYQRGLHLRGAVDFSDLIRLAHLVLKTDSEYLAQLRYRWPFILEDEAQDSSLLQEQILNLLVGPDGNWVRVGDPNQAIYETFTTANPQYLKDFLHKPNVTPKDLANSGRSCRAVIHLANQLIDWTMKDHPVAELRDSLTTPHIQPTPPGDPQPNPADSPRNIVIYTTKQSPEQEVANVADSIKRWLPEHPDKTVAVLCPIGAHAEKVVELLQAAGITVVEMLKSSESTRVTCKILEKLLLSLADPSSPMRLAAAFFEMYKPQADTPEKKEAFERINRLLKSCRQLEDYLYPLPGKDWLANEVALQFGEGAVAILSEFRDRIKTWQNATLLPVDQLVLTIAQELFTNPVDLAVAHKLALLLEFDARIHPEFGLPDFAMELGEIAGNRRKFLGFAEEESGFDPEKHKGEVFVSTFHKAKGLEWDRVYLLSVNNYDFPSVQEFDQYKGEKWFIRDNLNLEAECLAQLKALAKGDSASLYLESGHATQEARINYASERLRLLYVGITRAKENLIITWNTGRQGTSQIALPLQALSAILEKQNEAA
jgi:DNA helicase II / ATP-dependent DNA helicase PcrA